MYYIVFSVFLSAIIVADTLINVSGRLYTVLIWVLKAPFIFLEYFVLFWFWSGDGVFTLIVIPSCLIVFCSTQLWLLRKYGQNIKVKKVIVNSIIFITPVVCIAITYLMAKLAGIDIQIQ